MKLTQRQWTKEGGWKEFGIGDAGTPQLVLCFGGRAVLQDTAHLKELQGFYPNAHILMCSTAGEILDTQVNDDSLAVTSLFFEKSTLQFEQADIQNAEESETKGKELAGRLSKENLIHVMVFSDGLKVNGTSLVQGLLSALPDTVSVTGGLVGDGAEFKQTLVGLDAAPAEGKIVIIGFYSTSLKVGYGSLGGWDPFGPDRIVTRSQNNVLFELDGKPALALYKEYLGDKAKDLPASGLLFPLSLELTNDKGEKEEVTRTLLSVNEADQSMTFAGDLPEGKKVKLMKANFERLIDGAGGAASMSTLSLSGSMPDVAILISCIGRKLVLKERIEEELEAVRSILGPDAKMIGFYSYGEICPVAATEKQCQLHNQTMTITTFKEE